MRSDAINWKARELYIGSLERVKKKEKYESISKNLKNNEK